LGAGTFDSLEQLPQLLDDCADWMAEAAAADVDVAAVAVAVVVADNQ
jgi:hypothetical protein